MTCNAIRDYVMQSVRLSLDGETRLHFGNDKDLDPGSEGGASVGRHDPVEIAGTGGILPPHDECHSFRKEEPHLARNQTFATLA